MPRVARSTPGGLCYHVYNRGNARAVVFHDARDYRRFTRLLERARAKVGVPLLAWCLMPNHFHLVVRPVADGDLSRWMHWLMTSHVQAHRVRHGTVGRIWQNRFHAVPIQSDGHLLTVMRYVERNPIRAGLVRRADEWPWSSVRVRLGEVDGPLDASPVPLPRDWSGWLAEETGGMDVEVLRARIRNRLPVGDSAWSRATADRLGLRLEARPRGRPPARRVSPTPA